MTITTVLAELLAAASRHSPDRVWAVDRAARRAFGPDAVNAAHQRWTGRVCEAVLGEPVDDPHAETVEAEGDTPPGASSERSGSPAGPSEAVLHLIRRLPDPSKGGQAGQVGR